MSSTSSKKAIDRGVLAVAVIGSLALANVVALKAFGRLDLTRDKQYTLSKATTKTLHILEDPVTVRAYFSEGMPPPFSTNARYVRDLLEEYYNHGDGMFRYEFIDPLAEETSEDKEKKKEVKRDIFGRAFREKTSIEQELETLGVPSVQVRVNEDDQLQVKRAYMGLAIKYRDLSEVIPVVQETAGLEYDLTTLIRKMIRSKTPKIAFITGDDSVDPQKDLSQVYGLLGQNYEVSSLALSTQTEIPEDVDAVVVLASNSPYSNEAKVAIDKFVMSGRSAAFLLDGVRPKLQELSITETSHGLGDLLQTYGVRLEKGLVLDVACATISVQQQRGWMRINQPVPYPYMPIAKALDAQHPLTRGLAQVAFPFMSPLTIALGDTPGVKAEALVKSSKKSWTATPPYNLDPMQRWTEDSAGELKEHNLVVSVSGAIPSHFNRGDAASSSPEGEAAAQSAQNGRILVTGGASLIHDQFLSKSNQALVLNLMDWLLLDEALLEVRSRGLAAAPLEEVSESGRALVKYGNVLGLPALFVAFGLLRWRRREARRGKVSL